MTKEDKEVNLFTNDLHRRTQTEAEAEAQTNRQACTACSVLTSLCAGKGKAPQPSSQTRLFVLKSVDLSSVYISLFQDGWTRTRPLGRPSVRSRGRTDAESHLAASASGFLPQGQAG